jgi:hypothetical protein
MILCDFSVLQVGSHQLPLRVQDAVLYSFSHKQIEVKEDSLMDEKGNSLGTARGLALYSTNQVVRDLIVVAMPSHFQFMGVQYVNYIKAHQVDIEYLVEDPISRGLMSLDRYTLNHTPNFQYKYFGLAHPKLMGVWLMSKAANVEFLLTQVVGCDQWKTVAPQTKDLPEDLIEQWANSLRNR